MKPRYMVSVFGKNTRDQFFCHYLADAKEQFEKLVKNPYKRGVVVSIYDLTANTKKATKKF